MESGEKKHQADNREAVEQLIHISIQMSLRFVWMSQDALSDAENDSIDY